MNMKTKKTLLNSKLKKQLIFNFEQIKNVFNEEELIEKIGKIPINHYLVLHRIFRTKFDKLSDARLIMLSGIFDFTFSAGDYGYTQEQNIAINTLNDTICELKDL